MPKKYSSSKRINYVKLINESVHTSDDIDIGDIFAVNKNFIVVVRGSCSPITTISQLIRWKAGMGMYYGLQCLKNMLKVIMKEMFILTTLDILSKMIFLIKESLQILEPIRIPSKSKREVSSRNKVSTTSFASPVSPASSYRCDLCNISVKSESQLSKHLSTEHE